MSGVKERHLQANPQVRQILTLRKKKDISKNMILKVWH